MGGASLKIGCSFLIFWSFESHFDPRPSELSQNSGPNHTKVCLKMGYPPFYSLGFSVHICPHVQWLCNGFLVDFPMAPSYSRRRQLRLARHHSWSSHVTRPRIEKHPRSVALLWRSDPQQTCQTWLVGGWATRLRNDGLRQLGSFFSIYGKIKFHGSKPPTRWISSTCKKWSIKAGASQVINAISGELPTMKLEPFNKLQHLGSPTIDCIKAGKPGISSGYMEDHGSAQWILNKKSFRSYM